MYFNKMLNERQYGLTPQIITLDALMKQKNQIQETLKHNHYIALISPDVNAASHAACWSSIFTLLKALKYPANLYIFFKKYLSERKTTLSTNNITIHRFTSKGSHKNPMQDLASVISNTILC